MRTQVLPFDNPLANNRINDKQKKKAPAFYGTKAFYVKLIIIRQTTKQRCEKQWEKKECVKIWNVEI